MHRGQAGSTDSEAQADSFGLCQRERAQAGLALNSDGDQTRMLTTPSSPSLASRSIKPKDVHRFSYAPKSLGEAGETDQASYIHRISHRTLPTGRQSRQPFLTPDPCFPSPPLPTPPPPGSAQINRLHPPPLLGSDLAQCGNECGQACDSRLLNGELGELRA